jgi:hypothetical protein
MDGVAGARRSRVTLVSHTALDHNCNITGGRSHRDVDYLTEASVGPHVDRDRSVDNLAEIDLANDRDSVRAWI